MNGASIPGGLVRPSVGLWTSYLNELSDANEPHKLDELKIFG